MEADSIIVPSAASHVTYLLLGLVVAIGIVYYYLKTAKMVRMGNLIPGPTPKPIVGNALELVGKQTAEIVDELGKHRGYGKVVRFFLMRKLFVLLMDPRDIEIILSSHDHIDKPAEYRHFESWLGDGLLISTGHKWRSHRKLIAPTFHLNILKTFIPVFYENSLSLVKLLRDRVGREFDCHDYMSSVTVDILVATVMGVQEKTEEGPGWEYASAVMKMCDIIHRRHYNPHLLSEIFFKFTNLAKQEKKLLKIIHSFANRVIGAKKKEYADGKSTHVKSRSVNDGGSEKSRARELGRRSEKSAVEAKLDGVPYIRDDLDEIDENDVGQKSRSAFLDAMLEISRNGGNLTDKDIHDEVNTLMFEGHDTTAAGSSFVLCMLGIYRDIQTKVFQELEEIFRGSDRPATFDDTVRMKYLERVILESMRLYPPVPFIARKIKRDVKLHTNDYVLPAGTTIIVSQFLVHRHEEFYANPMKFDPDNFLPEKTQQRHYYSFIPFSAGPRSCVGRKYAMLKLKVLLSTILRNYEIQSDITEEDFRLQIDIILKRTDGFRIRIAPRLKSEHRNMTDGAIVKE